MRALQRTIEKVTFAVSGTLLGILIIILIYNVFGRFLGGGISWYMEASQYLNVWTMLIAGIGVCAFGQHLRIDGLESVLRGRWKLVDRILVSLASIAFYAFFTYGSYLFASRARQSIATIPALKMSFVYWMMPICGSLSVLSTVLHMIIQVQDTLKEGKAE